MDVNIFHRLPASFSLCVMHSGSSSGDQEHVSCISGQTLQVSNMPLKTFCIMETKGKVRTTRESPGFILEGPRTSAQRYFSLEQSKSQLSFSNTLSNWHSRDMDLVSHVRIRACRFWVQIENQLMCDWEIWLGCGQNRPNHYVETWSRFWEVRKTEGEPAHLQLLWG